MKDVSMLTIKKVAISKDRNAFLNFPLSIHGTKSAWIRPLDQDIDAIFDPDKNKFFKTGICERWLFFKEEQQVAQVATFVSKKYKNDMLVGGIGFFDCINDQSIANEVFDYCKKWMINKGMQAMDGPINFGERLKWWGLLTEGFHAPLYEMNYHPPYYQQLFENYGFENYYNQDCFGMRIENQFSAKMIAAHAAIKKEAEFSIKTIKKNKLSAFAADFRIIYNKAFAAHGEGKYLDERQVQKMFAKMKIILDENIAFLVYHHDEPIAAWINMPDLNQYFKHFNGQLGWWQKIQFLWMQRKRRCNRMVGIVFGVIPSYQRKGIDSYMIIEGSKQIFAKGQYTDYEMQWIGDFNPKMIQLAKNLGAHLSRRLTTYRYMIDPAITFKRHPLLK